MGELKLEGKDNEFGKYLFETYGSGLEWEFLPHPDETTQYRVGFKEGKKRLFLNGIGDGIRFGMFMIASCLLAKNTTLFIEEIENNQHPESLKKLIPFLVSLSKKNKLQVFITTHNPIVWNLFEKEFPTDAERKVNFQCYHVLRDRGSGVVKCDPKTKQEENEFWSKVYKDLYGE
jgi:AAA15 family ATPase/GTPase